MRYVVILPADARSLNRTLPGHPGEGIDVPIHRDGPVASETRLNLIEGLHSDPMLPAAVDAILEQAWCFTESLVDEYATSVAEGEVGVGGSGRASEDPIRGDRPPTVLLYGRVQSGKTAAMVLTTALALDNGFRIIIVLTADNVDLVRQTADRFRDLGGPRVFSTLTEEDSAEWRAPDGVGSDLLDGLASDGIVFVCAKNAVRLPHVLQFLQRIDAASVPGLVLDDEADAATPDTTLNARTSGRPTAPQYPSTINRRVIENPRPGELGQSVLEILPHSIYVQITASPFVLVLQRDSSRLRATRTLLLQPGSGYCGGERFFGQYDPDQDGPVEPPLVIVPDREYQSLVRRAVPPSLAASVEFAIVAAAARAIAAGGWPDGGFKHLSHTSPRVDQHELVAHHIERHLNALRDSVRKGDDVARRFASARDELARSCPDVPGFDSLLRGITTAVLQAQVLRINASNERPRTGPRVNFLIGGNILGRGLTISDLLVTYYLRQAQVSQMDTVLQHARMYGYRESLMPFTRVYLPRQLAEMFRDIHQSEEELRSVVSRQARGEAVPIRVARRARATRPSAVEGDAVQVYGRHLGQVAPRYPIEDPAIAEGVRNLLVANGVSLDEADRERRPTRVPLSVFQSLIELLEPRPDDPGRWSVDTMLGLVASYEGVYAGFATVYVRAFEERPDENRTRARLSGPEIALIRRASPNAPSLALMYWETPDAPVLWYPTLVFEPDHETFVFSPA